MEKQRVAVLGLGRMGRAMVGRLGEQGWELTSWTRSGSTIDGAEPVGSAADAVRGADVALLALYDGPACREVLEQCRDALSAEVVVLNTSTIAPDEAVELDRLVTDAGARYVHAPVIGSVPAVAAGGLTVLAGGSSTGIEETRELLGAFGSVVEVGDSASAAAAKLVVNGVLAGAVRTLGAGLTWAEELGLDRHLALDVLTRTPVGGLATGKRPRLEQRNYRDADFALGALVKDLSLLCRAGGSAEVPLREVESALASRSDLAEADLAAFADLPTSPMEHGLSLAAGVRPAPDVLEPLVAYVRGHATGDPSFFTRAFRPTAHIAGMRDGHFTSWTLKEYQALFGGTPAPDEASRRRRIESIEAFDSVATATMTLRHGPDTFVDAFVLLQEDGEWRIANKVYQRSPDSA